MMGGPPDRAHEPSWPPVAGAGALLVLLAMLVLSACRPAPPVPPPEPPTTAEPTADQLFADGRFDAAFRAYSHAAASETDPSEQTRLRLFRALALRGRGGLPNERAAFEALRQLEHEHGATIWGRVARLFVDEMVREEALRDTVLQAAARLRELQTHVAALEADKVQGQAALEEQRLAIASLKEERGRVARQLDEAEKQAEKQVLRIRALERELAALKQIDMQREP